ncbi:MAG: hypothetical protein K0U12_04765 [Gammaproteobacteria bacterium]|nr:hypothetical protein [Gammaproteobacteria bacterium]
MLQAHHHELKEARINGLTIILAFAAMGAVSSFFIASACQADTPNKVISLSIISGVMSCSTAIMGKLLKDFLDELREFDPTVRSSCRYLWFYNPPTVPGNNPNAVELDVESDGTPLNPLMNC